MDRRVAKPLAISRGDYARKSVEDGRTRQSTAVPHGRVWLRWFRDGDRMVRRATRCSGRGRLQDALESRQSVQNCVCVEGPWRDPGVEPSSNGGSSILLVWSSSDAGIGPAGVSDVSRIRSLKLSGRLTRKWSRRALPSLTVSRAAHCNVRRTRQCHIETKKV